MADLQAIVEEIHEKLTPRLGEGKVADYIPQLAHIDPKKFGMTIVTVDGEVHKVGDCDEPFSIQSVSKVFTLTLALGKHGETTWNRVGREPSGSAFNSIVQARARGRQAAQSVHQCRRHCRQRSRACRTYATRGDRRDRSFRALPCR